MPAVVLIVLLALVFGGVGLLVEGLRWALVIALALALVAAAAGLRSDSGMRGRLGRPR